VATSGPGYFRGMRFVTSAAGATLAALILAGCVQQPRPVVPSSTPTVAPVFATDADALAAAKTAYAGYLAASDAVARNGGDGVAALAAWESAPQFQRDRSSFRRFRSLKGHMVGASSFSHFKLESSSAEIGGSVRLEIYVCLNVTDTKLIDAAGRDVTPSRPLVVPLQLTYSSTKNAPRDLRLDGSDLWSGANFCS
jgi:hypothetical protein